MALDPPSETLILKPLSHPRHDAMLAASAREDPALLWGLTQTQATLATVTSPATISFIPHNPSLQHIGTTGALASTLVPVLPTGLNPGGQELWRVTLGRHPQYPSTGGHAAAVEGPTLLRRSYRPSEAWQA